MASAAFSRANCTTFALSTSTSCPEGRGEQALEALRTSTHTEVGRARMTYLQGECSYRRVEEVEEIQHRSSACSEYPPYLVAALQRGLQAPRPRVGHRGLLLERAHDQGLTLVHFSAQREPFSDTKYTLNTP